jgi:hypothetical protein
MTKYVSHKLPEGNIVILKDDEHWIPADPANSDYQQYLLWVAEGNTATEYSPE